MIMASAKRKDEKHLKILRELVSQTGNKECFDCRQPGPTYVNMTIGSFVCTSCSGMLRGLTPPHRVKSISMATFTQEEIDFVKERGNDHCKRIWLGLADSSLPQHVDTKDEQKMKDLMCAKYEHKRWFLDPSIANQNSNQKRQTSKNSRSNQPNIPRVPQTRTFATLVSPSQKNNKNPPAPVDAFTTDFVADFSKIPDPFQAAMPTSRFPQTFVPQPSFANFDNNPAFDSSNNADSSSAFNQSFGTYKNSPNYHNGVNAPPSEDRYAALKDLDSLMKQTQLKEETSTVTSISPWATNNSNGNASNSLWSSNNQTAHVIANPFASGDIWRPPPNHLNNNNNNNMQSVESSLYNPANPFRSTQFSLNNESQWIGIGSPGGADVIPSSQLMTPLSGKVWQPTVSAYHANPFMVGTGVGNMARNSNNPFL